MGLDNYVIETHGLSKIYKTVSALSDLALQVPKNSIFGFLGPNGAGKTTTIKLLLGLIRPTRGSGTVFGMDIQNDSEEIRARIGYLPQDPRFYENMTARQTLTFTAKFYFKGPQAKIDARVAETLDLVGLENKADRPIKGFSGGERQRLGIAQAQVHYPDLLILDEPAASLDPLGRRDVLAIMQRLRKHTTVFYCTHILDDVQRVSDQVAILNKGKLIAQGPIETLLMSGSGVIYTLQIKGETNGAAARIGALPWVSHVTTRAENGAEIWDVGVTDPEAAEWQLMRTLLADEKLSVAEFRRKSYDLEDAFLKIVEGDNHGGE